MKSLLKKDQQFKEAIGEFMILFSELEYSLACICNALKDDNFQNLKITMKMTVSDKRKKIKHLLNENELMEEWLKINSEIGEVNKYRKNIVHGIMGYYIPNDDFITTSSEKNCLKHIKLTTEELKNQSNKLIRLNTGVMGLSSVFLNKVRQIRD